MLDRIHTAPNTVLAIKAIGKITDEDYKTVLIPAVEDQIKAQGKVRLVYVIGPEFDGFTAKAALDDGLLGLDHWRDFKKVAVVTDRDWITDAMTMFLPLFPGRAKLFGIDHLQEALDWAAA